MKWNINKSENEAKNETKKLLYIIHETEEEIGHCGGGYVIDWRK